MPRQRGEREIERRLARHALARRVDQQRGVRQRVVALSHGNTFTTAPTACAMSSACCGVRLSSRISRAPASARVATTARAAPPAPSTTMGPASARQSGLRVAQALHVAEAVVVVAGERAVRFDDDRVDRADAPRERIDPVDELHRGHLVRDRHVAPGEAERGEPAQRVGESLRRDRQQHVRAGESVMIDPVAVQLRRSRMRHRPAHHAREVVLPGSVMRSSLWIAGARRFGACPIRHDCDRCIIADGRAAGSFPGAGAKRIGAPAPSRPRGVRRPPVAATGFSRRSPRAERAERFSADPAPR